MHSWLRPSVFVCVYIFFHSVPLFAISAAGAAAIEWLVCWRNQPAQEKWKTSSKSMPNFFRFIFFRFFFSCAYTLNAYIRMMGHTDAFWCGAVSALSSVAYNFDHVAANSICVWKIEPKICRIVPWNGCNAIQHFKIESPLSVYGLCTKNCKFLIMKMHSKKSKMLLSYFTRNFFLRFIAPIMSIWKGKKIIITIMIVNTAYAISTWKCAFVAMHISPIRMHI